MDDALNTKPTSHRGDRQADDRPMTKNRGQQRGKVDCQRDGTGHPVPMDVPDVPSRPGVNTEKPNLGKASTQPGEPGNAVDLQRQRDGRSLRQLHPLEYNAWRAMKDRVRTEGAVVHERWEDFANFLEDMGPKPRVDFSLDRIDPRNPMYGPGLCKWRDKKHQSRNRTSAHYLTDRDGTTLPLPAWAELTGQKANTLRRRKGRGWPDEWVIHGKPKGASGTAIAATPISPEEAVDALPYPVDGRELKIAWEHAYRQHAEEEESRLAFFIRWCRAIRGEALDQIPPNAASGRDPNDPNWFEIAMEDEPGLAKAVQTANKLRKHIQEAEKLLAEELERKLEQERERQRPNEGRRRTERALRQPGNFGRATEAQLDAIAFGYDPDVGHEPDKGGQDRAERVRPISWDELEVRGGQDDGD